MTAYLLPLRVEKVLTLIYGRAVYRWAVLDRAGNAVEFRRTRKAAVEFLDGLKARR